MKKEELFDLMGKIDEQYIEEAEEYKAKRVNPRLITYIGIAASVIIVAAIIGVIMQVNRGKPEPTEVTTTPASYMTEATTAMPPTDETSTVPSADPTTTTLPDRDKIRFNGIIYQYDGCFDGLPEGFKLAGKIEGYTPDGDPEEELYITGSEIYVGMEVYYNPDLEDEIYLNFDYGDDVPCYMVFKAI